MIARKEAKKAMIEAITQAFEGLYQSLGTKEGINLYTSLRRDESERQET